MLVMSIVALAALLLGALLLGFLIFIGDDKAPPPPQAPDLNQHGMEL